MAGSSESTPSGPDNTSTPRPSRPSPSSAGDPTPADLERLVAARRKSLGIDVGAGRAPLAPGLPLEKLVQSILSHPEREPPPAEPPVDVERARRNRLWSTVVERRGRRYAGCELRNWRVGEDKFASVRRKVLDALKAFAKELPARVAEGRGLVLLGPPGTGKDHLMTALLKAATLGHGIDAEWVNGQDLFGAHRDRIGAEEPEAALVAKLARPAILAISDPAPPLTEGSKGGALSDYAAQFLYRVIDARYSALKPTWLTLNVASGKEAAKRLGPQTVDRIADGALVLKCEWPSYRQGGGL